MQAIQFGKSTVLALVAALAIAAGGLVSASFIQPRAAAARPIYAQRTGLPCGQCHLNAAGGGARTAFGRAFAANGHRMPGSKTRRSARSPSRSKRYSRPQYRSYGYHGGMMGGYGPGMMGGYGGMTGEWGR